MVEVYRQQQQQINQLQNAYQQRTQKFNQLDAHFEQQKEENYALKVKNMKLNTQSRNDFREITDLRRQLDEQADSRLTFCNLF